jgi:hypothetical protein
MKIRGNTVGTTMKRPNFEQTNPKKSDYIVNNPIPTVKAEDDGKFLRVVGGKWAAVSLGTYGGETEDVT